MERGRGRTRCVLWGGVVLGAGTVLYALCSPSSVGCTTNLVVLTHSQVTARGCAAYSVAAHLGVGLIVLGAVLLLGSFVLSVRQRRHAASAASAAAQAPTGEPLDTPAGPAPVAVAATVPAAMTSVAPAAPSVPTAAPSATPPPGPVPGPEPSPPSPVPPSPAPPSIGRPVVDRRRRERRAPVRVGPIPPGEDDLGPIGPESLPPGWYGNPDNPGGPVQWWDGTRLVDRPR